MTWKQLLKNKLNKKLKRSQWYNTAAQATLTLHLVSKNMDSTCNDFSPLFATCEITPGAQHPHGEGWSTQHARKGWEREMGLVNPKKRRWRGNTLLLSSGEYRENTGRLLETCVTIGQAVTSSHWTREILSTSTGKKKKKFIKRAVKHWYPYLWYPQKWNPNPTRYSKPNWTWPWALQCGCTVTEHVWWTVQYSCLN